MEIEISFEVVDENYPSMKKRFTLNPHIGDAREIAEAFERIKYDVIQMLYFQKGLKSRKE